MSYFRNTVTTEQVAERQKQFLAALALVKETAVPVVCRDRACPLKRQAELARGLFKCLGLHGCFIRTPHHANATSVEVMIPWVSGTHRDYSAMRLKVQDPHRRSELTPTEF